MRTFAIFLLLCTSAFATPAWQQSQDATFELGVRDKYGELKEYDAVFIVKIHGKEYKATRHVKGDGFSMVYFPKDFKATSVPGKYAWECLVGGKVVATGDFKI